MNHLMIEEGQNDGDLIEVADTYDPYRDPLLRAKPEERATRGMCPQEMFGLLADVIDDEFLEEVLSCRGKTLPRGLCS